jgi:hypothetical protein
MKHERCPRCDGELRDRIAPKSGRPLRYCPICHSRAKRMARSAQPDRALAQARAHHAISRAVRLGQMTRLPCEEPGCTETKTEAHHDDYGRPLAVTWLCRTHHRRRHSRRKNSK